jgi:hypothetical protein
VYCGGDGLEKGPQVRGLVGCLLECGWVGLVSLYCTQRVVVSGVVRGHDGEGGIMS